MATATNPNGAGRPTKYTAALAGNIGELLAAGNTRRTACAAAAISEDTLANWLRTFSDFSDIIREREAEAATRCVKSIYLAAEAGNWRAAAYWRERRNLALTGDDGGPIQTEAVEVDLSILTDEELDAYRAITAKLRAAQPCDPTTPDLSRLPEAQRNTFLDMCAIVYGEMPAHDLRLG